MITTYRIFISLITIAVVFTAAVSTTYAYFISSQTFAGNIIATGNFSFQGMMTDINGLQVNSIIENGFTPGMTALRCIFIKNVGTLPGRYKLYRGADSGDIAILGSQLQVTATLNPATGPCASLVPGGFENATKYAASSVTHTMPLTDQQFANVATTPVKLAKTQNPLPAGQYVTYRFEVTLPSTVTTGSASSYTTDLELFGIQAEGSGPDTSW